MNDPTDRGEWSSADCLKNPQNEQNRVVGIIEAGWSCSRSGGEDRLAAAGRARRPLRDTEAQSFVRSEPCGTAAGAFIQFDFPGSRGAVHPRPSTGDW